MKVTLFQCGVTSVDFIYTCLRQQELSTSVIITLRHLATHYQRVLLRRLTGELSVNGSQVLLT